MKEDVNSKQYSNNNCQMIDQTLGLCKICQYSHFIQMCCVGEWCSSSEMFACQNKQRIYHIAQPPFERQPNKPNKLQSYCVKEPLKPILELLNEKIEGSNNWKPYNQFVDWIDSWIQTLQVIKKSILQKQKNKFSGLQRHEKDFLDYLRANNRNYIKQYQVGLGFKVKQSLKKRPKGDPAILQKQIKQQILVYQHKLQKTIKNMINFIDLASSISIKQLRKEYDKDLSIKLIKQNSFLLEINQQQINNFDSVKSIEHAQFPSLISQKKLQTLQRVIQYPIIKNITLNWNDDSQNIKFLSSTIKTCKRDFFDWVRYQNATKFLAKGLKYFPEVEELELCSGQKANNANFYFQFSRIICEFKNLKILILKQWKFTLEEFDQLMERITLKQIQLHSVIFPEEQNYWKKLQSSQSKQYELIKFVTLTHNSDLARLMTLKMQNLEYFIKEQQEQLQQLQQQNFVLNVIFNLKKIKVIKVQKLLNETPEHYIKQKENESNNQYLKQLAVLSINCSLLTDPILLLICKNTTSLIELSLNHCDITDSGLVPVFQNNHNITTLSLVDINLSYLSVKAMKQNLKDLQYLKISERIHYNSYYSYHNFNLLLYISQLKSLKSLDFQIYLKTTDSIAFRTIKNLKKVETFNLRITNEMSLRNMYLFRDFWEKPRHNGGGD